MISVLIDYKLEKYNREIKYVFDYVFETLGLSHRFISDPSHLRQHDILLLYGLIEPTEEELRAIACRYITIFIQAEPQLYDPSGYTPDKLRRVLREVKLFTQTPIISERKFEYPAANYTEQDFFGSKINFDLPGNIFFHLAGREEAMDASRDSNGCFPDSASAFQRWYDTPFIDNFTWLLDNLIKEQAKARGQYIVQKHYWPKAEDMAAALTHSVGDLQKWDFNSILFSVMDDLALLFTLRWQQLFRNIWSKLKYIFTNYEMYWNFQEFMSLERENNLTSTWFIASEKAPDIDYTLDDADLQDELKQILRQGGEIGLLATDDKLNRDAFITRKQIMLRQLQKEQLGIRQNHYLLHDKIRDLHQRTLPLYDSSSALNDTAGYRHGLIFPYQAWISSLKSNHLELPVCFRDEFLKTGKYSLISLEDAKQMLKKAFQSVRRRKGLFCLDFTPANYTDIPYCSKLYSYILALIKAEKAYCATLGDLAAWWGKRSRVTIDESEYDFSISFPDDLESFAIQFYSDLDLLQVEGAGFRREGSTIHFSNIKANSVASVRLGRQEHAGE